MKADIRRALEALAAALPPSDSMRELWVVGGAAVVLLYDARLLLSKIAGDRASVWQQVEPHLVPGRELKARYAFDDLWEADRGPA